METGLSSRMMVVAGYREALACEVTAGVETSILNRKRCDGYGRGITRATARVDGTLSSKLIWQVEVCQAGANSKHAVLSFRAISRQE